MTRSLLFVAASLLVLLTMATPAEARTADFGVRGGVYPDQEEPFVGAEALFGVGETPRWFGNPNVEHVLADGGDLTAFSFDFHYDFPTGEPYTFWVGTGPTLIHRDRGAPGGNDTTDAGLNVLLGVGAKKSEVRPYGQLKIVLADDSMAVLGVGVRF
jgi:hypothetical protein